MIRQTAANRSAGFVLVEVVIALAISALVFGYAFRALSGGLDRLRQDQNSTKALLLAESTLDRVGHDIALGAPASGGSTGDGFTWQVETAPYTGAETAATGPLIGYVVRVTVLWNERSNTRQVQLTTLRLAYRARGS
jgi:prepilin-type N-terminal cleavage/methylation domain-containing protein